MTVTNDKNSMEKFKFLLGEWDMDYNILKSTFSEKTTGTGEGIFKRALDNKYIFFNYLTLIDGKKGQAHGVFAWDEKSKTYRYWWFESSGNFSTATCNFINDKTLFLNWHDTLLIQTFQKIKNNKVILRMEYPNSQGEYELVLEVIFTRK